MYKIDSFLQAIINCSWILYSSLSTEARRNRRNPRRYLKSNSIEQSYSLSLPLSKWSLDRRERLPCTRNPSSRGKERYREDPSREFSRFFLDPRRFRRAHCVTGPHFSARDDYPSVQFMSANDCNLRLIQRCEMVPLALPLARLVARPAEFRLACNKSAKQPKETSGSWSGAVNVSLFVVENYSISPPPFRVSRLRRWEWGKGGFPPLPPLWPIERCSADNIVPQAQPQIETALLEPVNGHRNWSGTNDLAKGIIDLWRLFSLRCFRVEGEPPPEPTPFRSKCFFPKFFSRWTWRSIRFLSLFFFLEERGKKGWIFNRHVG